MPGNIFLVDFNEHRIIEDTELKKRYTEARPYGEYLDQNAFTLHDVVKATAPANDRLAQLSMDDPLFALPATPTVPVVESIDDSSAPVAMDEQSLIGLLPWLRAFGCVAPWFDDLLQGGWLATCAVSVLLRKLEQIVRLAGVAVGCAQCCYNNPLYARSTRQ